MKAILCNELGGPENLVLGDIDPPKPKPDEVRIRVRAAGVNFADTLQIAGKYQSKLAPPFVPGMEVAGEILEIGRFRSASGSWPSCAAVAPSPRRLACMATGWCRCRTRWTT